MKKLTGLITAALLFSATVFAVPQTSFSESFALKDTGSKAFPDTNAKETVYKMSNGWNLGNTFDATSGTGLNSETGWGQPLTTKAMIDKLAASGVKTIRIPVSWARHVAKQNYTIDPFWMERVKTVVDWAIDDGMYVIINSHHDDWDKPGAMPKGSGFYPNSTNYEESERFLANIWAQISLAFNNGYDEHLIFETMNEPRLKGTNHEWWFDQNAAECKDAADCLNRLNQTCVDVIRASGGNNQKRFIMVPGLQASPDSVLNPAWKLPVDDEKGKLIVSVHMYTPYSFAMETPGSITFTTSHKAELAKKFARLNASFISQGIPVIIGEYGATNKDNLEERVKWFEYFLTKSREYGMTACLWDNGNPNPSKTQSERYGYYNRTKQTWYFPEITDKIIEVTKVE